MTYSESANLMTDTTFRGRIKVAVVKYADAILLLPPGTSCHTGLMRWANQAFQQPDQVASQVQPPVVMDPAVQANGSAVTDAALQSAVEAVVNKSL